MKVALVLPAAGSGQRLGLGIPKALVDVGGAPLLRRTLDRLGAASTFEETLVMAPPDALDVFAAAVAGLPASLGWVRVLAGGATRQASVAAGVAAAGAEIDLVCVHDAARPLVPAATVRAVLEAAAASGAATAASRPADSVRIDVEGARTEVLDRSRLWLVETPQAFARRVLAEAHARAVERGLECTDDASLVEAFGQEIRIVGSVERNLKVTVPADLELVARLLETEAAAEGGRLLSAVLPEPGPPARR